MAAPPRDTGAPGHYAGRLRPALALFALALAAMAPAFLRGAFGSDSGVYDHVWTTQFAEALRGGAIYPRWLPDSYQGYGDPTFYFYPPATFYLSALLQLAGLGTVQAVNAAFAALLWASGLTMYAWLKGRARRPLLWACVYVVAPYHLTDAYARQALAETGSFVWLPLIALGLTERRWRLFAGAYAGLICTHLPVALLTSVTLVPALALSARRNARDLLSAGAAGVAGIAASGIYLVPALALQRFAAIHLLYLPFYRPESWSVLAPAPFVFKPLLFGLAWYAAGLCALLVVTFRQRPLWTLLAWLTALAGLGLLPVWGVPLLAKVQFPWRLFGIVEFSALSALAMARARAFVLAAAAAAATTLAAPGLILLGAHNLHALRNPYDQSAFARRSDTPEYLPARMDPTGIDAGRRVPQLARFGGERRRGRFWVAEPGRVVLSTFYFPAWTVTSRGRPAPVEPFGPGQLVSFKADRAGFYELQLQTLPEEWIGLALSVLGVGAIALIGRRRLEHRDVVDAGPVLHLDGDADLVRRAAGRRQVG